MLFTFCYENEVETKNNIVGSPYEATIDQQAKDVLIFIRANEKDLGRVNEYRKQIVAGVNHYFEFTKKDRAPIEIIVHENLNGEY